VRIFGKILGDFINAYGIELLTVPHQKINKPLKMPEIMDSQGQQSQLFCQQNDCLDVARVWK